MIAQRKEKLKDPSTSLTQKAKIEYGMRQLIADVDRWRETIRSIDLQLDEINDTSAITVEKFKI